jgi:hypothetical protein
VRCMRARLVCPLGAFLVETVMGESDFRHRIAAKSAFDRQQRRPCRVGLHAMLRDTGCSMGTIPIPARVLLYAGRPSRMPGKRRVSSAGAR